MKNPNELVNPAIRELRVKLSKTQYKDGRPEPLSVGDLAQMCGVSRRTVYHWEHGFQLPGRDAALKLEKIEPGIVEKLKLREQTK